MSNTAVITFHVEVDDIITPAIAEALEALASVMEVQAEDGLYTAGYKEGEEALVDGEVVPNERVAGITSITTKVQVVR
jgi:hypothetical protein